VCSLKRKMVMTPEREGQLCPPSLFVCLLELLEKVYFSVFEKSYSLTFQDSLLSDSKQKPLLKHSACSLQICTRRGQKSRKRRKVLQAGKKFLWVFKRGESSHTVPGVSVCISPLQAGKWCTKADQPWLNLQERYLLDFSFLWIQVLHTKS